MQTVELYFCDQIIDVSPLHGIKNLVLCYCSNIEDISGLGNHHRLAIADCEAIERGYECFRSVQHAVFHGFEISDLTVFHEVKSLEIYCFSSIENQLFLLKDIPELLLVSSASYGRKQVLDISHLTSIMLRFDLTS